MEGKKKHRQTIAVVIHIPVRALRSLLLSHRPVRHTRHCFW